MVDSKKISASGSLFVLCASDQIAAMMSDQLKSNFKAFEETDTQYFEFSDKFAKALNVAAIVKADDGIKESHVFVVNGTFIRQNQCDKWLAKILFSSLSDAFFEASELEDKRKNFLTDLDARFLRAWYGSSVVPGSTVVSMRPIIKKLMLYNNNSFTQNMTQHQQKY